MRSSIILTSVLATLAIANPVDKRYLTTKLEVYTIWTTVTKGAAATTATSSGYGGGRHRHRSRSSSAVAEPTAVSTSTDVVAVPTSTAEALPSSSDEATSSSEAAETSSEAPIPVTSDSNKGVSPSAPASSAPAASSAAPPSKPASSSYGQNVLYHHNIHRENHTDTGALSWSDALAATALKTAMSCVYKHDTATDASQYNDGRGYGQNIGAGSPAEEVPAMITNGMYNGEISAYDGLYGQSSPDMSNFHAWGHFSQIVWRNTKEVGCATFKCGTLANTGPNVRPYFTVCNYSPPGNYGGQYTNVGRPLGKATVKV